MDDEDAREEAVDPEFARILEGDDDSDESHRSLEEPLAGEDENVPDPENGWIPSDAEA